MFKPSKFLGASAFALMLALPALSKAQVTNTSGQASINVVSLLTVTLVTNTSWGTVTLPGSGTTTYNLDPSTSAVTVTSGNGHAFGDGLAGSYLVTGGPLLPVSYSVSIGSFSGTGVTAVDAYINGTSSSGSGSLSVLGTMVLNIGGVVEVASTASLGIQTATITVTTEYL